MTYMKPHKQPGLLIAFCGLDGCGKTTMIQYLYKYLTELGYDVMLTRQPSDMIRNSDIFRTFMDCEDNSNYDYHSLSLLAAGDRVQHSNKVIIPALQKGKIVISDRYYYSCMANLRARGYKRDKWIHEIAKLVPRPDLSFFLNVDVETAVKRVRARESERHRWIDIDLQYKLHQEYRQLAKSYGGFLINSGSVPEETFPHIREKIDKLLTRNQTKRGKSNGIGV